MFTDMVGYTAISQRNEALALEILEEHRKILREVIRRYRGTEIKTIGDAFLVEFVSALDATLCATEIQKSIHVWDESHEGPRIILRIGIHLGDVVHSGSDVLGNAVNIASRVEAVSEPEGVCITQQVFDEVRSKIDVQIRDLGLRHLKNVDNELRLFQLVMPWNIGRSTQRAVMEHGGRLPVERIVVLPFLNYSQDQSDSFFSDGMTEELIDRLAQVRGLRVIARTTAMQYRKSQKKVSEIGTELGVGRVIEGSVRKSGSRLRITAQLVDANTEEHLWSSSYDKDLGDIFAIQSDIADRVVRSVVENIPGRKRETLPAFKETTDVETYTYFLQGRELSREIRSSESMRQAVKLLDRVLERDPRFARAMAVKSECLMWLAVEGMGSFAELTGEAKRLLSLALRIDPDLAEAYSIRSMVALHDDDVELAEESAAKAITLNPSLADPYRFMAQIRGATGDAEEMVRLLEKAYEIDPMDRNIAAFLGHAYLYSGRITQAFEHWERTESILPYRSNQYRAEYYFGANDLDSAEKGIEKMKEHRPDDPWTTTYTGILAARRGDYEKSTKIADHLKELEVKTGGMSDFLAAFVLYAMGDKDGFYEYLARAQRLHAFPSLEANYSPLIAEERGTARMERLLEIQKAMREKSRGNRS